MQLCRKLILSIATVVLLVLTACATPVEQEQALSTRIELQQLSEDPGVVTWEDELNENTGFIDLTDPNQDEIDTDITEDTEEKPEMPTYISNLTLKEFDIYRQTDEVWEKVGRIEERGCAVMSVCTVMSGYDIDYHTIKDMVYKYRTGGCAPVKMFQDCGINAYYFVGIGEDEIVRRMLKGEVFIIHEGPGRWTDSSHYMPLLDIRTNNGKYEVYIGNTIDYGTTGWYSLGAVLADMEDGYGIYSTTSNQLVHQ